MSKYTENAHEHQRINKNCRLYRARHRKEYNEKIRLYRQKKKASMTDEQLQKIREKRRLEKRRYRAKKNLNN